MTAADTRNPDRFPSNILRPHDKCRRGQINAKTTRLKEYAPDKETRWQVPLNLCFGFAFYKAITVSVLLLASFAATSWASPAAPPENMAKTHMKNAESLMKDGKPFEAYQEAEAAVQTEPSNKKFRDKLSQIGHAASQLAETKAQKQIATNPLAARTFLQTALQYDPLNESASQTLRVVEATLLELSRKSDQIKQSLDLGNLSEAQSLIDSISSQKAAVPSLESLQKGAESEHQIGMSWSQT